MTFPQIRVSAPRLRAVIVSASLALAALAAASVIPEFVGHLHQRVHKPHILVSGDLVNQDCRTGICKHNENTDLIRWGPSIFLVHRTANSQILGPNSSLRVSRSDDLGQHFALQAIIQAPPDRDIRDPAFYIVGDRLYIKALTRVPSVRFRDEETQTIAVETHSTDGVTWSPLQAIGPETWSFWRVKARDGMCYSAAYEDGDLRVDLFSSPDGEHWTHGAEIYGVSEDTPLETELVFMPSGRLLGLVRMDGTDFELLGNRGRLRTKVCWAEPPYDAFECPQELNGVRLDGPVAFFSEGRLFVIARKHIIGPEVRKRTALYEITGQLEGGPIEAVEWGELPSAGDTSYAGVAPIGHDRFLATWYSSPLAGDPGWIEGFLGQTDLWWATIRLARLPSQPR